LLPVAWGTREERATHFYVGHSLRRAQAEAILTDRSFALVSEMIRSNVDGIDKVDVESSEKKGCRARERVGVIRWL
jgi:hypothetical protein